MPSTAIGKIDYDAATQSLWIRFVTNGRRYLYSGVPLETADAFRHAFAKGSYFNRHIRDQFEVTLVDDPRNPAL
jgi:KTSC domain